MATDMKEVMDRVFETFRIMPKEEFKRRMEEAGKSEIGRALKDLSEFEDYLAEEYELKLKREAANILNNPSSFNL